jgi:uncharacterized repeat protein (TIGR03803 family)
MKNSTSPLVLGLAVAYAVISLAVSAQAQTFTVLSVFNGTNANTPTGPFIQGTNGDLYNVSYYGGTGGSGNVFYMTPAGTTTDLYSFCLSAGCNDGANPTSIILGKDGNFYGTTGYGGNSNGGVVFKMTLGGKDTTLYSFCPTSNCSDGYLPNGIVQGSNGNFYGTALVGGAYGAGTIFELTSFGTYKVLYNFCTRKNCNDGSNPVAPPIQASNGNFYGTASNWGSQGSGVVYEITPAGSYKVLYNFCSQANCTDGASPKYLVQDASGNFYGTTIFGGTLGGYGTIFKITPTNQFIVLHTFQDSDGANPIAGLIIANDGNLYGTTYFAGNIFQTTPAGVFTVLYTFCSGNICTGTSPNGLFQRSDGILYGTTQFGGQNGYGEAFSYSYNLGPLVETVPVAAKVGKRVIILGNGLTGSTSVTFNGVAASFTVESDTYIKATVPEGATTGTVSVVTPTGTLNSNPVFRVIK